VTEDKRSLMDQLETAVEAMLRGEPVMLAPDPTMGALMGIASDLRDLPRDSFLQQLQAELREEGDHMLTAKVAREGYKTLTPYIVANKAPEMVEFMKQAFGAEETFRAVGEAGGFHIEARVGHSMLMIGGGGQYRGPEKLTPLHYFVGDVDEAHRRALEFGATSLYAPVDQPYGVRECAIKDVAGVDWYISTPIKDARGHQIFSAGDIAPYLHPKGADKFIEFIKRAFDAEEMAVYREPFSTGPVVHARFRIVDSMLEFSEAHDQWQPVPSMLFLYVDNADGWFNRAVRAGAKVVSQLGDLPYGRSGGVEDAFGNQWYVCTPPPPK
jgi:PhnB protein